MLGKTVRIAGRKAVEYGDNAELAPAGAGLAGRFDRAFTIPFEIEADQVKAECRDGMLALYLRRAERDKPKAIAVG